MSLEPLNPASTALLVLDMHQSVVSDGPVAEHLAEQDQVSHIVALLSTARATGAEVIHVHHKSATGIRPGGMITPLFKELAEYDDLQDGADGMDVVPGLEPLDGEIVVHKQRVSAFTGTDLELTLRAGAIDSLILTGTYTNLSVESTARYAADLGYRVVLASDALSSVSAEWHEGALAHGLSMLCDVATTADVVEALDR
ncbi:cysteine hydrolase family protein [Leifsonia shinshuensis]|uniref:Cysteine hydrolase n=1 Tax=Leifsonia shinshuensis TaxID=150026 RepID=A0A7G6YA98_9MICO|nr:cysteine hydrolase [Leifsonia shinshuensis]QNE35413.1 cysteine hydrolase [Leifsonia shinshuensis]